MKFVFFKVGGIMKELSISRGLMHLVLKKCVSAPSYNSLNYLQFALVSMKTENLG